MKIFLSLLVFFLFFSRRPLFTEESFIDLRTFIHERTQQYTFQGAEKIYLNTPLRTGSTLVYNVLRFLFEAENHQPFENQGANLILKLHAPTLFDHRAMYICTLRNPLDASLSAYWAFSNARGALRPFSFLDKIIKGQVDAFKYLDALVERGFTCLVLRYEEFVNDFESLFCSLEKQFNIIIDPKDRAILKRALSKENVNKNIERFSSFSEHDEYHHFHGNHIYKGELSDPYLHYVKSAILSRLSENASLFQRWGYTLNP
jgi:hypothetical protein